ncbi:MAG: hypothetical protein AB7F98_04560 [Novosphingobium sp.]
MTTAILRTIPRGLIAAVLALTSTIGSFAAATSPALAMARGGAYAATLSSPLPQPRREIVDGAVWRCDADRCAAPASGARAITVCTKVSRKFGPIARFSTPQGELTAEELARCNEG